MDTEEEGPTIDPERAVVLSSWTFAEMARETSAGVDDYLFIPVKGQGISGAELNLTLALEADDIPMFISDLFSFLGEMSRRRTGEDPDALMTDAQTIATAVAAYVGGALAAQEFENDPTVGTAVRFAWMTVATAIQHAFMVTHLPTEEGEAPDPQAEPDT